MKKVLILSYNALPMDVVSAYRAKGYCDYFFQNNIFPTLITHRWELDDTGKWLFHGKDENFLIDEYNTHKIIRLPRPNFYGFKNIILSKLSTFYNLMIGQLDPELVNSYKIFKKFIFNHLRANSYDLVIAIYSPHYHLKLVYEIKKEFRIPYVLDFRDLWDNQVITKSYHPNLRKRIIDYIILHYWKKWIKSSLLFTVAGEKWKLFLQKVTGKTGLTIRNGFDDITIDFNEYSYTDKFRIIHFGRIYDHQNLSFFLEVFNDFLTLNKDKIDLIEFELIGLKSYNKDKVLKFFSYNIPEENLKITNYLSKNQLFEYLKTRVSLLYFPGFYEDDGSFAVKVYDYFKLEKNIVYAPDDGSETARLINTLNVGKSFSQKNQLKNFLQDAFNQYLKNGYITFNGNSKEIKKYSRSYQVEKLSLALHSLLK